MISIISHMQEMHLKTAWGIRRGNSACTCAGDRCRPRVKSKVKYVVMYEYASAVKGVVCSSRGLPVKGILTENWGKYRLHS